MALDNVTLAAAKKFTRDTADAMGAVRGSPCEVESIVKVDGGTRVTYKWTGTDGAVRHSQMTVPDGAKGDTGEQGEAGEDGFSPTAAVEQTATGAVITITDKGGTTTAEITNGSTEALTTEQLNALKALL